jgi:hypothetical protein
MMEENRRSASIALRRSFLGREIFLTNKFLQGERTHACSERSFGAHTLLMGVGEEVHGSNYNRVRDFIGAKHKLIHEPGISNIGKPDASPLHRLHNR